MRCGLLLLLSAGVLAGNSSNNLVYFESRETGNAPVLEIEFRNGATRFLTADADSILISYLAGRAWGRHPHLSVQLGDKNRALIRFDDVPAGALIKKAEDFRLACGEAGCVFPGLLALATGHRHPPITQSLPQFGRYRSCPERIERFECFELSRPVTMSEGDRPFVGASDRRPHRRC